MENDMALLQFLRSKTSDRFTKLDAFCDLIGRMSEQVKAHKGCSSEGVSPLCHGYFTGSISELAQDWHWHRATVRSFLDGLESLGIISRKLDGRDYTFKLRTHASISVPIITNETVIGLAYLLLEHWDESNLSPEFLAAYFEAYYAIILSDCTNDVTETEQIEKKTEIVLEAFAHLEFSVINNCQYDDTLIQVVSSTFTGKAQWSWSKWMRALMYMDFTLMGDDFPEIDTLDEESLKGDSYVFDFTQQDMRLLRELFYQMKKKGQADAPSKTEAYDDSSSLISKDNK